MRDFRFILAVASLTVFNTVAVVPNFNVLPVQAQGSKCLSLEEALVPVKHPIRTSLNKKFRAEGKPGEINNVVRIGNYGAAYWWNTDGATPVAIKLKGGSLDKAVTVGSNLVNVLKSWGASPNTAKCVQQVLEESGI